MKLTDANRPLRVLDKVLQGGLGTGNLGLIMARHGMGKLAVLTSIAIDHAMDGRNTLHVSLGESAGNLRALHDEVLHGILQSLDLPNRGDVIHTVERHKQIYTYRDGRFDLARLRQTLDFLRDGAEFKPELIELSGWPDFERLDGTEIPELKKIAQEYQCEIWLLAHTHSTDQVDAHGVPDYLTRWKGSISALIALEPQGDHSPSVRIHVLEAHGRAIPSHPHLEFDPTAQLIRWR